MKIEARKVQNSKNPQILLPYYHLFKIYSLISDDLTNFSYGESKPTDIA